MREMRRGERVDILEKGCRIWSCHTEGIEKEKLCGHSGRGHTEEDNGVG